MQPRSTSTSKDTIASARERLIVALDTDTATKAREIVEDLKGEVFAFKIGLQLFTAEGPSFVSELVQTGERVFLDLKFHDIPNTTAQAAVSAARLGVWMMNFHAAAGTEALRAARLAVEEVCGRESLPRPLLIGVTLLTSSGEGHLRELGFAGTPEDYVVRLAKTVRAAGLDGVVASACEAAVLRREVSDDLVIVTPGIRPADGTLGDQKRVMTFREAIESGSTYAVVGRPITAQADRRAALANLIS
ncbi:MAG: orotidine-5'-phosphate decarboxylase [Acidobacteria bacterium OLB17]|nr:MAG: orotidine-5'-phosphate decarboxylase [Acidobacteria bacterium OLB17]MCZ2389451.1 orotidine-5'-phosphate decarboxylase [Acidobacteriota bacterium]